MTKLSTYLPLEDIKKSKKLQEIKTREWYKSAITIADVINNSKELFGEEYFNFSIKDESEQEITLKNHIGVSTIILTLCFNNKPINEISEFIIKNIKE